MMVINPEFDHEISMLVDTIDEASKQARNFFSVLAVACSYALAASFSDSLDDFRRIPIINLSFSIHQFYVVMPILILAFHAILHIFLSEIRDRLSIIKSMNNFNIFHDFPEILIKPSIFSFPFLFEQKRALSLSNSIQPLISYRNSSFFAFKYFFSFITLWLLAPITEFILWWQALGVVHLASMVGSLTLVITVWLGATTYRGKVSREARGLLLLSSTSILLITLSSISETRELLGLQDVWSTSTGIGFVLASAIPGLTRYTLYGVMPAAMMLYVFSEILPDRQNNLIRDKLEDVWIWLAETPTPLLMLQKVGKMNMFMFTQISLLIKKIFSHHLSCLSSCIITLLLPLILLIIFFLLEIISYAIYAFSYFVLAILLLYLSIGFLAAVRRVLLFLFEHASYSIKPVSFFANIILIISILFLTLAKI